MTWIDSLRCRFAAAVITALVVSGSLYAQGLGTIVGTVTDPSGALVPAATVRITDEGTSLTRESTTNAQGYFVFPSLRPSSYSVAVEAAGFAPTARKGLVLEADQSMTVNFAVSVQEATQALTVEAPVQQVDTSTATLSEVVDRRRVIELPLNGRNAASLALITAGTVLAPASADEGSSKTFPVAVTISANGSRQNQAAFRLDGANNNDIYTNVNQPFPFPDAIQEFSVQTSNYSARYGGNAGGVVNIVTKSGDNQVHGDLFEFVRNSVFNARDYFAAHTDPLKRNQFGGTLGGPVVIPHVYNGKDKTFFFIGYQGTRIRNTALGGNTAYFPTAADLNGDFSSLLNTSDPNNPLSKKVVITDPTNGNAPFANNQIPTSMFDPAAKALTKYLPVGVGNGLVSYAVPTKTDFDETLIRVDHSISEKDRITGRYFFDRYDNAPFLDLTNLVNNTAFTTIDAHNFMVSETHTFSPTVLNDLRLSVAREVSNRGPASGSIDAGDLGVKLYQPPGDKIIESLSVAGYFSISMTDPATFTRDQYGLNDTVSWVHGSHSFTFGADVTRAWVLLRNQFHEPGQFGFTADYDGNAMASFLLGDMRTFLQGNGEFKDNRVNSFGLFAQDDWHVSRRLTVNLGLRFDPFFPWKETKGRVEVFSPAAYAAGTVSKVYPNAPPGLLFPGDPGVPQYGLLANYKNFSPRVGFAYDLTGDGKTSLRGGFGMFYDALQNGIYNNRFVDVTPFSTQVNLTAPKGTFSNPYAGIVNPFPAPYPPPSNTPFPAPVQVMTYDTANGGVYKTPVSMDFNLTIERQLKGDWLVRFAYVGLQARHLLETQELSPAVYSGSLASPNSRRLFPQYGSIALASQDANSNYNSLQLTAQKRFSSGFTVLANYTWSKSLDDVPFATSPTTVGVAAAGGSSFVSPIPWYLPGRHQFDYGPSEFDHQHRLTTSFVWQLPALAHSSRPVRYIVGGWQLSGLLSAQTGGPMTVIAGKDQSGTATADDRAYYVGGVDPYGGTACGSKAPCVNYLNPAAFTLPPQGSVGNVGKGSLRGPGMFVYDGGLSKEIPLYRERVKLQFKAEFFDLFNHANFMNPGMGASDYNSTGSVQHGPNVSGSGFGQITADNSANGASSILSPRIGQLALKLIF
ncbi:MAG TPA: carboxypeptidase regulatory-like domain-containing protein [Bryobacteraceae bacterium]|nr:carboxypeptidase regulatory-like domain-containing protein [Bryobacteraceae bacterium]